MGDAASGDHYCDVGTVLSEMSQKKRRPRRNPYMIRSWTLYIVRFEGGYYYVTTTTPKNFIGPINQHGGPTGASVNKSRKLKEIVEVRPLGAMPCYKAEYIENNFMLLYRRRFGPFKVQSGYEIYKQTSIFSTLTRGSPEY